MFNFLQGGSGPQGGNLYADMARAMMPTQMGGGGGQFASPSQPQGQPSAPPMGGMSQPMTPQQAAFPSAQTQQQQNFARNYQILNSRYNYQPEGL